MSLWTQLCGWPGIHRGLTEQDLDPDPVQQFQRWLRFAGHAGCHWPNAMCLATVGADGAPAARMVLLKDCNADGFSFYTHINGRKGRELAARPAAALVFHWVELQRQVRLEGAVESLPRETAAAYFATRPRLSQLGAWASRQSEPLADRATFNARLDDYSRRFANAHVPMPPHWGGYRLRPARLEFWQGRRHRLHDRFLYCPGPNTWQIQRLYP